MTDLLSSSGEPGIIELLCMVLLVLSYLRECTVSAIRHHASHVSQ